MKSLFLALLIFSILSTTQVQAADGMNECITKSLETALSEYAKTNSLFPIPELIVSESDGRPSNGIDIMVTINSKITYYVIATPDTESGKLLGCKSARVSRIK